MLAKFWISVVFFMSYHISAKQQTNPHLKAEQKTQIRSLILDMDGVLRRGFDVIEGAASLISWMTKNKIPGMILTNECRYTEKQLRAHLNKMKIPYPASMPYIQL